MPVLQSGVDLQFGHPSGSMQIQVVTAGADFSDSEIEDMWTFFKALVAARHGTPVQGQANKTIVVPNVVEDYL